MGKERFKAYRSQMFYEKDEPPFSDIRRYEKDASHAIAIGALLSGDPIILGDLIRSGRVYYWLVDKDGFGVAHKFEGRKEERRWVFTRLRDSEKVLLGKIGVTNLRIQRNLTNKQIKDNGYLYGVPEKKDIS